AKIAQGLLILGKASCGGNRRQGLALAEGGTEDGAAVLPEDWPEPRQLPESLCRAFALTITEASAAIDRLARGIVGAQAPELGRLEQPLEVAAGPVLRLADLTAAVQ